MDDIIGKIGELLSDEESMKQLSELAQIFLNDSHSSDDKENACCEEGDSSSSQPDFDISSLIKLAGLFSEMNGHDKNTDLIIALKPHLSEEKAIKADKAVKLLKLLALWTVIKDSGLLKDIL